MSLNPCPQCGSPAEIFATGTLECYGWAWQHYGVKCTDVNDRHCGMEISIQADFFYFDLHDGKMEEIWNNLPLRKSHE